MEANFYLHLSNSGYYAYESPVVQPNVGLNHASWQKAMSHFSS